ncbi:MAG: Gfo/Idh/MocA family oxidoreductase [Anaerolineales bacterium]|nr:Gfo/Idh/MocA family oxidoreductase [Anaerolineales bacterium]
MTSVRWGILSTANINRRLIPVIRESARGELIGVASRSLKKADQYARKWHIPTAYGSYEEMLQSGEIDAVYISLPNHLHAEWSIKALHVGVHVLCEKPFATSLEDVDAMISASRETDRILAEAFMYRHHPQTKLVGEWVHSGKLGEITLIRGALDIQIPDKERRPDKKDVRLVPEYGGGSLWDVGVYPLSYTQYLMGGPPSWVLGRQQVGDTGVDEVFAGQMGYSTGSGREVLAQISSSFKTPFHSFMEIVGTKGRLYLNRPFTNLDQGGQLLFMDKKGKTKKIKVPKKSLYLGEVEDLQEAILDGTPPYISLTETRDHIRTALALYESARTGQVKKIVV